jgi:hypothetical protein
LQAKSKPRPKTRWTREFKFGAVARMDETANFMALIRRRGRVPDDVTFGPLEDYLVRELVNGQSPFCWRSIYKRRSAESTLRIIHRRGAETAEKPRIALGNSPSQRPLRLRGEFCCSNASAFTVSPHGPWSRTTGLETGSRTAGLLCRPPDPATISKTIRRARHDRRIGRFT